MLNWRYVEQEKGIYTIDPVADATITEAVDYGVNVVVGLTMTECQTVLLQLKLDNRAV